MVSVPTAPGRSVQVQEQPRERFRYAESRNFVGRAVEQAGRALGDAAQDWDQVEAVYDTAAVKKLENSVTEAAREALWTGEDPYFNKQGFDAADARVSVEDRFKELREQALSQTKNDRQRNMLTAALDKRLGDNLVEVAKHATGQLNVELQKQTEARLVGFQQDAVQLYSDPEKYADNLAGGLAEINALADQQGWSDARIDAAEEKFVSGVHTAVITGRLTSDDIDGALGLLEKYRDDMEFNDVQSIESKLQPAIQYRQAEEDATVAMGAIPSPVVDADTPATSAGLSAQLSAIESNESNGKQFTKSGKPLTSSAGAIGVMQVMPGTAPEAARLAGLAWDERRYREDENYNRALGQAYYKEMLRTFGGDPIKAAAAYNAGPGSARRGTGVYGAMAKARKAGEPDNWVSYLPAETRDYVAKFQRKAGAASEGGEGSAPRKWDLSVAYTALEDRAKKEAWTPERLERARQRVDERVKRDEMLEGRRESDEWDSALGTVDRLAEGFTDVTQVPNFDRLSPDRRMQLRNMAESNRKALAGDGPKANGDMSTALEIMAIEKPEEFLGVDLREYRGMMTPGEFASLQKKAATIRAKPQEEIAFRGAISGTLSAFATPDMNLTGDTKRAKERRVVVTGIMETYLRGHVKPGQQPTQAQLMEAMRFATGNVAGTDTPRSEFPVYKEVPPDILQAIVRAYRAETGRNPTDGQIISIYRKGGYK